MTTTPKTTAPKTKAPYFPPPPPIPPKTRLFQRTPPAIFTPIMGLFGLGLAWRRAADGFGVPMAFGDALLGAVTLLFLFSLVAYVAKLVQRPATFFEDLMILPGRAGLTAMMLSGYLLAATLEPHSLRAAAVVLGLAALGHALVALRIGYTLMTGPTESRSVTPVWHLTFVGVIIAPLAALPLGLHALSGAIFWAALVIALAIWGASLAQLIQRQVPAPLRPLLAIHLSPACLLGTVAFLLGKAQLGLSFAALAFAIFALLVLRARWLCAARFSALWGAFTFPLAAFATLMQIVAAVAGNDALRIFAGLLLVAATLIIVPIAYKVMLSWAKGMLAVKTNAAQA